jgi:membrane protein DedA with SNARE-associated domain
MASFRETLVAWGPLGIFASALIESLGVPNPGGTDALILLVSAAQPNLMWECTLLSVVGSLIGSAIFHHVISKGGDKLLARRAASPRGQKLRAWFDRYGLASVFVCALVPVPVMPLKVMALCACGVGVNRFRYLGVVLAARFPRYLLMAYLGAKLGENSSAWLKAHLWHMGIGALLLVGVLFSLLKATERRRTVTEL